MKEKFWMGIPPSACDICKSPITKEFVDGATTMGPWANMDPACFRRYGRGLGLGKGQRYQKQEDGRFKKIDG